MFDQFRKSGPSSYDDQGIPRKTTEVHVNGADSSNSLGRAQTREPALIMLEGDIPGQVFRLRPGRQVIGRRPECEIRLRERAVSGTHAELIRVLDAVSVNDLASTNGTVVNGLRIRNAVALTAGSLIKVGTCVFKYVDSLLEVEFTEALHARGIKDQLTGAINKSYLLARLSFLIDTASESRPVSVIAFDFDNFKHVNDQYGHAAGDHILRETSALISDSFIREQDLFARTGGEEFAIILPDTPAEEAAAIADSIRRALETKTFDYEGVALCLTSSFGVCDVRCPTEQAESVLARADELLYRSKREGRNRVST